MSELSSVEDHIQYARRYYNGCARELNVLRESFPYGLIGSAFGFGHADYFQLEPLEPPHTPQQQETTS